MTDQITTPDLHEQLAAARRQVGAAHRDAAAAALDERAYKAAIKRRDTAQADVDRLELALSEQERQATAARDAATVASQAQTRIAMYEWIAEYMRRAEAVLRAREQLQEAESYLISLGSNPRHTRFVQRGLGPDGIGDPGDLDPAVIGVPPFPGMDRAYHGTWVRFGKLLQLGKFTAGQAATQRALAEEAIAAEKATLGG